jgi:integrase
VSAPPNKFSTAGLLNPLKETSNNMVSAMQEVQKSRTTPFEDSKELVPGYPVRIYLYPASKYYQACTVGRMNGTRPRISLETESRTTAIRAAKEWYNGLLLKAAKGEALVESPDFKKAAEELFKEDLARVNLNATSKNKLSQSTYDNNLSIYNSALVKFFGDLHCKNINKPKIRGYIVWINAREGKKKLSDKTINNHLIVLSKILKKALELKSITVMPEIPDLSPADNPRGWLTNAEYVTVRGAIDKMIAANTKVRYVPVTEELKLLAGFMLQTYLRPGDLPLLKHKHIQLKQTAKGDPYLLVFATSKTDDHYAVAVAEAIGLYSVIKGLHPGKSGPDDYVFFPQFDSREHAMSIMTKQFTEALKLAGLKFDDGGKKRDLYSMRHTCISRAILSGIPIADVARNAGTSVDMIERFYASKLRNEMAVDKFINAVPQVQEVGSTLEHLFSAEEATA